MDNLAYFRFYDLPFSIIDHILVNLPVKNLANFRAVCTFWRAHIESLYFISKHRNLYNKQNSKNSHLLIEKSWNPEQVCLHRVTNGQNLTTRARIPFPHNQHFLPKIHNGCNGLFLIDQNGIGLWNPFLGKSLILPPCPIASVSMQIVSYVIGFSPSGDDYKVLAFRLREDVGDVYEPAMAVYSLRNHIWNIKINPVNVDAWNSLTSPRPWHKYVYCGSLVYWVGRGGSGIIHSFDFNREEFNNLVVPEPLKDCKIKVLFTVGDLLAVITSSSIMVLEKLDEAYTWRGWCSDSWVEDLFRILKEQYSRNRVLPTLFFIEQNNTFLIVGQWGEIKFYQVTSQRLELLIDTNCPVFIWGTYMETLELITGAEGMVFKCFQ
ncbi:unnamed protein product [Amaranthus hypochondriacus]